MNNKLIVQETLISIRQHEKEDFISLTDIARAKNSDEPKDVVKNWLRNKNTIEFLGLWEQINNPDFKGKDCNFIQRDVELINKHFGILPYFPNFKLGPVIGSSCDSLYKVSIEDDIRIGPNPVQDELTIYFLRDFAFTLALQFELYSTDGKLILNKPLTSTSRNHPVDLRGIPEGVYVYRLSFEEGSIFKSGKVVVLH